MAIERSREKAWPILLWRARRRGLRHVRKRARALEGRRRGRRKKRKIKNREAERAHMSTHTSMHMSTRVAIRTPVHRSKHMPMHMSVPRRRGGGVEGAGDN